MKSSLKIVRIAFVATTLVLWFVAIVLNYESYWGQQPIPGLYCTVYPESFSIMLVHCPFYWLSLGLTVATALLETALLMTHEQRIKLYFIEVSILLIPLLVASLLSAFLMRHPPMGWMWGH